MNYELRRFSDAGAAAFAAFLARLKSNSSAAVPWQLLTNDEYSEPLDESTSIDRPIFTDLYEFGSYLTAALSSLEFNRINRDRNFWSWLALHYFDSICPAHDDGLRSVLENAAYVMESDANFQRYYRHLVRTPWFAVRTHGKNARVLLTTKNSAAKRSEIFEQLASRQELFGSPTVISTAFQLYFDEAQNAPKRGAGGKLGGSARRLASVIQQFALTYDLNDCTSDQLLTLLPREFDRWRAT